MGGGLVGYVVVPYAKMQGGQSPHHKRFSTDEREPLKQIKDFRLKITNLY